MGVLLWVPLLLAAGTAVLVLLWPRQLLVDWSGVLLSAVILAAAATLAVATADGQVPTTAGGMLRADALSAYMLVVVGCVALTATWGGVARRGGGGHEPRYAALVALFLGAMSLAVLADNLGVVWVAIEATTIATAFLVGHHRTRLSLEAAWKYVVLGSVGVAIAFLGIVLLYAASLDAGNPTLSWVELVELAPQMDTRVTEVAVALGVLGFATKAGLAPMHSWLPDAHSQAPAPVSGLMSGVLLSVALYVILRLQVVADLAIGAGLIRWMLAVGGVASLLVASLLLLRQRDYKRMLAYSSIEHMGIMAVGAAAGGPLGMTAVLVHMLGHGLVKSSLFVVAGRVLAVEGTTAIDDVRDLLVRRPGLGAPVRRGHGGAAGVPAVRALLHRGRHRRGAVDRRDAGGRRARPAAAPCRVHGAGQADGGDDAGRRVRRPRTPPRSTARGTGRVRRWCSP